MITMIKIQKCSSDTK